ncbi:MAG: helix-turn-helix domain-containing protein [bacterium]|nr:helix-turn-helix domain-containing protein [bacterium]
MLDKNQQEDILKGLSDLGMSRKEAQVYISLLLSGEVGSSKIIKDTSLHGQYVYQSLERLESNGFVQHIIKRGRKKFSAKNPNMLTRLADEKKALAENLVAKLNEIMILPPEQHFEVFQGKEAYVAHEFDMLERAKDGCQLLIIAGTGDQFNQNMGERLKEYSALQIRKNIIVHYLGSEAQRSNMTQMHGSRKSFEIKYLPGLFTGYVNTNIWPDALGFNIYGEPVTRFTIWNPVVAGSYSQFFKTLWNLAKP